MKINENKIYKKFNLYLKIYFINNNINKIYK